MTALSHPDRYHLDAATGWLMLDNPQEARREAEQISVLGRLRPEAMVLRWQIHARLGQWTAACDVAQVFTRLCPAQPAGWLCLSYAFYRLERFQEAFDVLLPRAKEFPKIRGIPYLLACYAWQCGRPEDAERWLARSAALGGPSRIQNGHLAQADLGLTFESKSAPRPGPEDPASQRSRNLWAA
jgi:predicted Zn-dependent protease